MNFFYYLLFFCIKKIIEKKNKVHLIRHINYLFKTNNGWGVSGECNYRREDN